MPLSYLGIYRICEQQRSRRVSAKAQCRHMLRCLHENFSLNQFQDIKNGRARYRHHNKDVISECIQEMDNDFCKKNKQFYLIFCCNKSRTIRNIFTPFCYQQI